jgi:hypothetical protein
VAKFLRQIQRAVSTKHHAPPAWADDLLYEHAPSHPIPNGERPPSAGSIKPQIKFSIQTADAIADRKNPTH